MKFIKTPVKGMCDMLPADMRLREHILQMIKTSYAAYGFMQPVSYTHLDVYKRQILFIHWKNWKRKWPISIHL